MKGVLDRFEGDMAVILIEDIKEELIIPREKLPAGSKVNTYFQLEKTKDTFQIVSIDEDKTLRQKEKTSDIMAKLRAKSKGSKFKKQN